MDEFQFFDFDLLIWRLAQFRKRPTHETKKTNSNWKRDSEKALLVIVEARLFSVRWTMALIKKNLQRHKLLNGTNFNMSRIRYYQLNID